jgi:hypothetical protein
MLSSNSLSFKILDTTFKLFYFVREMLDSIYIIKKLDYSILENMNMQQTKEDL